MNTKPTNLDIAAQALRSADTELKLAQETRDAALYALIEALPTPPSTEGATKYQTEFFAITTTTRTNRTISQSKISALDGIEHRMRPGAFNTAFKSGGVKLDTKGLAVLQHSEPEQYAIACEAITSRPGKPTVKITINLEK